ncbi:MAG: carboxypeptidase-like regulatory domain-containing protein, partial [Chitinophagaceae bacterium]|nr:carboxypeptidase-like regulatory domain-containing protein [Chitinophagaceae bacterium]
MKLTAFLLLICCLHVAAGSRSQTITLSGRDIPVATVFAEIEKQTGYVIISSYQLLEKTKPVTVNVTSQPVEEFIKNILKAQHLTFTIKDKTISIKEEENKKPSVSSALEEALPIKGVVRDAEGNPLGGINIVIKGTKRGVVSDAYGNFMIDATAGQV